MFQEMDYLYAFFFLINAEEICSQFHFYRFYLFLHFIRIEVIDAEWVTSAIFKGRYFGDLYI